MTQRNDPQINNVFLRILTATLIYCLIGMIVGFAVTNADSLISIINHEPSRTYQANQIGLVRWTALDQENHFCSEDDPIILFPAYNGYIRSVEMKIKPLEDTPECKPRLYWSDPEHPVFSEECSQTVYAKKTDDGYVISINRYIKEFRLDLYTDAGAKIRIDSFIVNPRNLEFPGELLFPIAVISLLLAIYVYLSANQTDRCDVSAAAEKVYELDIIRALCAIGIVLFHVSVSKNLSYDVPGFLRRYANGDYGSLIVGMFFMISGGVLYHNYKDTADMSIFYYKRWKAIFPMFYITYLFFFIQDALRAKSLFYKGKPWRILLSFCGLDGYLRYKYAGYYIVGEWFLGAIVLLYLLYPIYAKLVKSMGWNILLFIIPLVTWQLHTNWFEISKTRNLIYCSTQFIMGMLIFKYRLYQNKSLKLLACCISVVLLLVPIPNFESLGLMISCVFIFIALFSVAKLVLKLPMLRDMFTYVGSLSFPMFLIQNKVISFLTKSIEVQSHLEFCALMLLAVFLSLACAWCIKTAAQSVMRTSWFSGTEKAILSLRNRGE